MVLRFNFLAGEMILHFHPCDCQPVATARADDPPVGFDEFSDAVVVAARGLAI